MRKLLVTTVILVMLGSSAKAIWASEGFNDLAKLAKSGVGDEVMLAFVEVSPESYDLTVDEILYLNDLGVSQKVITAVLKHGESSHNTTTATPALPVATTQPSDVDTQAPVIGRPVQEEVHDSSPVSPPVDQPAAPALAPPQEDLNISYFYDSLSPYGRWIDVEGTYVWQPTVVTVNAGWRPYCDGGNWIYTDCGWAWHSDYSWGWAAFHYGRWSVVGGYGWVWTPDVVWAPAWVAWRSSDAYCGWAPLPPTASYEIGVGFHFGGHVAVDFSFGLGVGAFTFVPIEHMCAPTVVTYAVPTVQVTNVYNNTTVINNTYVYNNNRIVNQGVPVSRVSHVIGRDITPVHVVDANYQAGQAIGRNSVRNNEFVAYRPQITNAAPLTPAAAQVRRQERLQREIIRQQALTEQTAIRQNNKIERVEARQNARTQETVARQADSAERVHARQSSETLAAQQRIEEAEARRQAELEQRIKTAEANKARREAEERARVQQKTTETARPEQEREVKRQQETEQAIRERVREEARREAEQDAHSYSTRERNQRDFDMGNRSMTQPPSNAAPARDYSQSQSTINARDVRRERDDQAEAERRAREAQRQAERDAERTSRDAARDSNKRREPSDPSR